MRAGWGERGGGWRRQVDVRVRRPLIARLATLQLTTDNAKSGGEGGVRGVREGKGKTLSLLWHQHHLALFYFFLVIFFLFVPVVLKPISNHI